MKYFMCIFSNLKQLWRVAMSHPNCAGNEFGCPAPHHYVNGEKQQGKSETKKPKSMVLTTSIFLKNKHFTIQLFPKMFALWFMTWNQEISAFRLLGNFAKLHFKHPRFPTSAASTLGEKEAHGFLTKPRAWFSNGRYEWELSKTVIPSVSFTEMLS